MKKLVRDLIPQIIEEDPERTCDWYIASDVEYRARLYDKMREELDEFIANPCYEEAADMFEVMRALFVDHALSMESVENVAMEKRMRRGAFYNKIVLERVD